MLKEVCKDIRIEPHLQQLTGETLQSSTLIGNQVRLDVCSRGFWQKSQMEFFDVFLTKTTKDMLTKTSQKHTSLMRR